mgnify:CR=1 FL=1
MILNILSEYWVIVMKYNTSQINNAVHTIKEIGGSKVKFIILYGSVAANTQTNDSDIDITVFYDADERNRFQFRIKVLGQLSDDFDVTIFQDLPLYVQREVFKGKVLYASDLTFVYEINRRTYQEFEDFKHRFYDYIKGGIIT